MNLQKLTKTERLQLTVRITRDLVQGKSPEQLMEIYDLNRIQLSNIENSPLFKDAMEAFQARLDEVSIGEALFSRERFIEEAPASFDTLIEIRDHNRPSSGNKKIDQRLAANISQDVLDRAGFSPIRKEESTLTINLDLATQKRLERALDTPIGSHPTIIDVEPRQLVSVSEEKK